MPLTLSNTSGIGNFKLVNNTNSGNFSLSNTTVTPIVTTGLVLNYNINDASSYPGTGATVTDLTGSSNATLYNSPTYTSSGGGYLTFNGSNQYLGTNTDLAPKLNQYIVSIFLWVYPMDNGVIVSELGSTSINTGWHDSQLEMVAGTLRFSVWSNNPGFASNISTPLNNWYYMGFTFNGAGGTGTLTGYVNGVSAVTSGTITRTINGSNYYYAIAAIDGTNLGDGTYANMRFGGMQIYNTALSAADVLQNYNAQKSRFGL